MTKLIVGLGNPGLKYKYTRHNAGFILVDKIAEEFGFKKWKHSTKFDAKYITKNTDNNGELAFLKPLTFMNDSGAPISRFMKYYDIKPEELYVIHDDLDLPFLEVKKQFGAGSAGHNGVGDIIEKLGTKEFWRIRIGVGRPANKSIDPSDWVLMNFSKSELDALNTVVDQIRQTLV